MDDITSKNVNILAIYQALNYSNYTIPLGQANYQSHSINVKYDGTVANLEGLENLPVGMGSDNVIVHLKDVADISLEYPQPEGIAISEGSNLIMVSVTKKSRCKHHGD